MTDAEQEAAAGGGRLFEFIGLVFFGLHGVGYYSPRRTHRPITLSASARTSHSSWIAFISSVLLF